MCPLHILLGGSVPETAQMSNKDIWQLNLMPSFVCFLAAGVLVNSFYSQHADFSNVVGLWAMNKYLWGRCGTVVSLLPCSYGISLSLSCSCCSVLELTLSGYRWFLRASCQWIFIYSEKKTLLLACEVCQTKPEVVFLPLRVEATGPSTRFQ